MGFIILLFVIGCVFFVWLVGDEKKPAYQAAPVIVVAPTLDDTLRKAEIRAQVYLKVEYGMPDAVMISESWYPAQMMEVVKWRAADLIVVTQTKFIGTDIKSSDAYHNWSVKVVNKYRG